MNCSPLQGQHYALTMLEASSSDVPDDLHKTIYSEIQPQCATDSTPHKSDATSELQDTVCAAVVKDQSSTGIKNNSIHTRPSYLHSMSTSTYSNSYRYS